MKHSAGNRGWLWLTGVLSAHAALLAGVVTEGKPSRPRIEPPTVIGMLIAAPTPAPVVPPKPLPPVARPTPQAHRANPAAPPPAPSTPSQRTLTAPPAEPATRVREELVATTPHVAAAAAPEPSSAPVVPPRTDAAHLNNPAPAYPAMARRFGEEGRVLFDVYILADGRVGEIKLKRSSGSRLLDQAALEAVRRWRYVPAHRGSEPIPYWYVQPITFSLDS